jgi:plasmid maintenance system antidote protein VapI
MVTITKCADGADTFDLVLRTNRPFAEEVPRLMRERDLSQRKLAHIAGVTPSHLSRILRHADKTPSPDLARRIVVALGLPHDYFVSSERRLWSKGSRRTHAFAKSCRTNCVAGDSSVMSFSDRGSLRCSRG